MYNVDYQKWLTPYTLTVDSSVFNINENDVSNIVMKEKKTHKTYKLPYIKQIYFNKKSGHTAIVWEDGTSTVVRCGDGETFEDYLGFCAAVCKKLFGSTCAAKKLMDTKDADKEKARKEEERLKKVEKARKTETENKEKKKKAEEKKIRDAFERIQEYMKTPDFSDLINAMFGSAEEKTDG